MELSNDIKTKFNLNCDYLKIICDGKLLKDDSLLSSQNIKVIVQEYHIAIHSALIVGYSESKKL